MQESESVYFGIVVRYPSVDANNGSLQGCIGVLLQVTLARPF